uniref:Uncharacterized protein n=1 Tax=Arundo donax TaxID=35708 RepID=A0A0A9EF23_ARUDO
MSSWGLVAS